MLAFPGGDTTGYLLPPVLVSPCDSNASTDTTHQNGHIKIEQHNIHLR